ALTQQHLAPLRQFQSREYRHHTVQAIAERLHQPAEFDTVEPRERLQDQADLLLERGCPRPHVVVGGNLLPFPDVQGRGKEVLPRDTELDDRRRLLPRWHEAAAVLPHSLRLRLLEALCHVREMLVFQEPAYELGTRIFELTLRVRPAR